MVSELLQTVSDILIAKFPGKTFLPGYTAKGGSYHLEIILSFAIPFSLFEKSPEVSMVKHSVESCIEMMVASIDEEWAEFLMSSTFRQRILGHTNAWMAWEEERLSYQLGSSPKGRSKSSVRAQKRCSIEA